MRERRPPGMVLPPLLEREKKVWMLMMRLDLFAPYQGADRGERHLGGSDGSGWRIVAAGREPSHRKMTSQTEISERRNNDTPMGYSGRTALRRGQCDAFDHLLRNG
jgi:hypothetical protein